MDVSMPWDCLDTFGKRLYIKDSGQAHLSQWPLKIRLISPVAPYFHNAHLLLAADCTAFSYSNFHAAILRNRILIIGCPELDGEAFEGRLLEILKCNDIQSVAVARMDAPCCRKLTNAVIAAVKRCRKDIPIQFITVYAEGEIVD